MNRPPSNHAAALIVSCATLAVLVVMTGLLVVPQHAIVVLTIGAVLLGIAALMIAPGLVNLERFARRAHGEGTGADDASAHRAICVECGWHWRIRPTNRTCPRCAAPVEPAPPTDR